MLLTKKEIIEKYNLSSRFLSITKSKELDRGFDGQFYTLTPKYSVSVLDNEFDYNQSQIFLGECFGLNKPLYFCNNDIYVGVTYTKRALYNRVKKPLSNDLNSILDIQANLKKEFYQLKDDELLFAFRSILQDAYINFECSDVWDFIETFGFECGRDAQKAYNCCIDTCNKLKFNEQQIGGLLDNLSDLEIC